MDEDPDSHTAPFDRRQPLIQEDPAPGPEDPASRNQPGQTAAHGQAIHAALESSLSLADRSAFTPSMSWNVGTKAKIRTKLGGRPHSMTYQTIQLTPVNTQLQPPANSASVRSSCTTPADHKHPLHGVRESSESDGHVILNIEEPDSSEESESYRAEDGMEDILEGNAGPRLHDDLPSRGGDSDARAESNPIGDEDGDEDEEGSTSSEEENGGGVGIADDMMRYSASDRATVNAEDSSNHAQVAARRPPPQVLADLDSNALQIQLKYFWVGRDPKTIDSNEPVRCVRCAQPGHVATYCSLPLCFGCEFKTEHLEKRCPYKSRKCSRCHERGHDVEACPHKLKRITAEQKCELCSTLGHGETDCELLWRTSGRPWEKDLPIFTVRLFCYECGQAGHLGNDCPTRQPGKPFGSSTWSAKASAGPPISTRPRPGFEIKGTAVAPQRGGPMMNNTSRGISIKGRADAHRPSPALDDDDSPTNFHRPRIPAPARPSQIHVSLSSRPSTFTTTANIATTNGRADDSYGRRRSRSRSPPRTHERSDYQASRYNGTGQEGIGYRDQGRGSVGRYEPYGTRYEEARRAPVSYEVETRRRGGGARYRPMPSAARGAWGKYRS